MGVGAGEKHNTLREKVKGAPQGVRSVGHQTAAGLSWPSVSPASVLPPAATLGRADGPTGDGIGDGVGDSAGDSAGEGVGDSGGDNG